METTTVSTPGNGAGVETKPKPRSKVSTEALIEVTFHNKSALLMDAMSDKTIEDVLIRGIRTPPDRESPLDEMAKRKMYRGPKGEIILPANMLFASLRNAGRKIKVGKVQISTAKTTELSAILTIEEEHFVLYDPDTGNPLTEDDMLVDLRRCMMKGKGDATAVGNVRPRFNKWAFKVTLSVDYSGVEGLTEGHIRKLVEIAGNRIGVGSWRPTCNGPMGRFRVESFDVVNG